MSAPRWDLEPLFSGGAEGPAYLEAVTETEAKVEDLLSRADALPALPEQLNAWTTWLVDAERLSTQAHQISTFAHCCFCEDVTNKAGERAAARSGALWNRFSRAWVPVQDAIARGSRQGFDALIARPEIVEQLPKLLRMREQGHLLLPLGEQALATELSRDGIGAWSRMYDSISGRLTVQLGEESLSAGQAQNRLGSQDPSVRDQAYEGLQEAWTSSEDDCARALTHIVGARQTINDRRGLDELADTLAANRLERASLDAMLEASRRAQPILLRYLKLKAKLLGVDQMSWEDLSAPLPSTAAKQDWPQAESFVMTHFGAYHPELQDFAGRAFSEHWIEAEDRGGKRPGGWCAFAPAIAQSRIFMTHGGTFRSTVTLAHELGHAYHNHVTADLPPSQRAIPSTLAETASIFAESLVRDAALRAAKDGESKRSMLDARLMAGVSFLMNIPMRYDFERALYRLRRKGPFDPAELREEIVGIQKSWYGDSLERYDPSFWCAKLHFYIGGRSFYNYPYTYGYLFAQLVYRQVLERGPEAHQDYIELLRRTGWQGGEDLAMETLGLDLRDPETWWQAIAPLEDDLNALEALV